MAVYKARNVYDTYLHNKGHFLSAYIVDGLVMRCPVVTQCVYASLQLRKTLAHTS